MDFSYDVKCVLNVKYAWIKILDMKDVEMEQLAKHLGHDAKTHKDFYRLSDSTIQLSKAGVIIAMLIQCDKDF